jgi:hypothetical protein
MWTRGNDPLFPDYKSWAYPTSANPYISKIEIDEARKTLPTLVYQQEYEAAFLDDVGTVFRGVDAIIKGELQEPRGGNYVMGADLAKLEDFTVLSVLDDKGHLCAFERFSELDWVFQRKRIVALAKKYRANVLIDSSGVGEPIFDELQREQLSVSGYKFTNASKKELVENLSIMIENMALSIANIPELINELKLFGYKLTSGGTVQYCAPESYHDDCVISLALAAWQLKREDTHPWFA